MWTTADWKDKIVAVIGRFREVPVLTVACVPLSLEGKSQHSGVVAQ